MSDQDEFETAAEEFKGLVTEGASIQQQLKRIAATLRERQQPYSAEVVQQLQGQVMEFLLDVVNATGAHLDDQEQRIAALEEGGGEGIPEEIAMKIAAALYANNHSWKLVRENANEDQRRDIDVMVGMNEECIGDLSELTGMNLLEMVANQARAAQEQAGIVDGSDDANDNAIVAAD